MGNLSASLKAHAVTLFEAGKLPDEAIEVFLQELEQLEDDEMTAAMMFEAGDHSYVYAHVLKQTLLGLRHNASLTLTGSDGGVDLLRIDSLLNLGEEKMRRVLEHNYVLLMSLVPFAGEALTISSELNPMHLGPVAPSMHSPWFRLWLYRQCGSGPVSVLLPQGTCFSRLAGWISKHRIYRVEAWKQDAVPVQVEGLLPYLLEVLPESPVMLQATDVPEWPTEDVAFPFAAGCWDRFGPDREEVMSMAAKLGQSIDLEHTCGFLRMVQVKGSMNW